ncbi:UNVERIFIED_CONTAM: hypothetical protein HDU68_002718 [Siphonaria sp. JEL0065]|nr:hypothetical protein HDU68_002718 [Siphonaria sp. JEL0065]
MLIKLLALLSTYASAAVIQAGDGISFNGQAIADGGVVFTVTAPASTIWVSIGFGDNMATSTQLHILWYTGSQFVISDRAGYAYGTTVNTNNPNNLQLLQGTGIDANGNWNIVFSRPLAGIGATPGSSFSFMWAAQTGKGALPADPASTIQRHTSRGTLSGVLIDAAPAVVPPPSPTTEAAVPTTTTGAPSPDVPAPPAPATTTDVIPIGKQLADAKPVFVGNPVAGSVKVQNGSGSIMMSGSVAGWLATLVTSFDPQMKETNPFAQVASATSVSSPFRRALVVAPAMCAVVVAAYSVLVSDRALLALAATLAWLVTVVAGPTHKTGLYAQLLDRWWAASLVLVVLLSLFPQTTEPRLSSFVTVSQAPMPDSLLVHVAKIKGAPWGCLKHEIVAFGVFRSHRTSTRSGKFGEWAQVNVASIPHEDYLRPPLVPRVVLNVINPLQWPIVILSTLRTYTTIIELGIVWPLLTRVLRRVLINYREDAVAEGKPVADLDGSDGIVRVKQVLEGVQELFIAMGSLFLTKKKKSVVSAVPIKPSAAGASVTTTDSTIPPSVHFFPASLNHASDNASVSNGTDIKRSASPQTIDTPHSEYNRHSRSSSSPVRLSTGASITQIDNDHYTANLHKPIMKLAKSQSLWDDSSAPSRFVGSLVSSVAHGLTNSIPGSSSRRRPKRWEIPGYVFVVIKGYEPAFKDELSISIGNIIRIKKIFDDGWALGVNQSTDMQGILPMAFLTCINPTSPSAPPIDPQQFIPRAPGSSITPTNSLQVPSQTSTSLVSVEEVDEAILPYTDAPPQHLRKRGRSVSKAMSTTTTTTTTASTTPTLTHAELNIQQTPTTNTTITVVEKPRGRSSSLHRNARNGEGGGRGRGRSSSKGTGMLKSASSMSLKSNAASAAATTATNIVDAAGNVVANVIVPNRGRLNSVASATSMRRGRRGKSGDSVYHVPEEGVVGGAADEEEEEDLDLQFEDSLMDLTGDDVTLIHSHQQQDGGEEEENEIEEVVVFEEEEYDEKSSGLSDEDKDVWPPVRPSMDRKSRVSLGGYSMA